MKVQIALGVVQKMVQIALGVVQKMVQIALGVVQKTVQIAPCMVCTYMAANELHVFAPLHMLHMFLHLHSAHEVHIAHGFAPRW